MQVERLASKLNALSPLNVLSRGYALVQTGERQVVRSAKSVEKQQKLFLRFSDGVVEVVSL
jgi:exodeoxyribonuclease VII large subunit